MFVLNPPGFHPLRVFFLSSQLFLCGWTFHAFKVDGEKINKISKQTSLNVFRVKFSSFSCLVETKKVWLFKELYEQIASNFNKLELFDQRWPLKLLVGFPSDWIVFTSNAPYKLLVKFTAKKTRNVLCNTIALNWTVVTCYLIERVIELIQSSTY